MLCAWFVLNKSEISNQRNTNNQYVVEFWCVWNALRWVPVKSQKPQKKNNTTFLNSSVWNALTTITTITTITTTSTTITTTSIYYYYLYLFYYYYYYYYYCYYYYY